MKAVAILPGQKDSVHLQEIAKPQPKAGELLVQVLETGVCGTDLEIIDAIYGTAPAGENFLVLGHESFGKVVELGRGLENSDWSVGDYVVSTVRRPCHANDPNCESGHSDMCRTGQYTERGIKEMHGYMTEYYTESVDFAVKVPPAFRSIGVLLEPTAVVEKAVYQAFKIQERLEWQPRRAIVFGAGPIGLLATFLLRDRGLEVYTIALSPGGPQNIKATLAERCGATYISTQQIPLDDLKQTVGEVDLIVEASGSGEVAFKGLDNLAINGVMVLTSVTGGHNNLSIDPNMLNMQIMMGNQVVVGSVNANRRYFEMGAESWQRIEKKWPGLLAAVITRKLPFEAFKEALIKDRTGIKTVLQITNEE
ncbi:MAG TPA: glucose 1-dehydrogenase [Chloroflexia bacterium]|nr:glucose 1-dehydrogenase [Chloroflexia bacterium]